MCEFPSPVNITDFLLDDVVVTFDPSSMVGDRQNATITINDDSVLEGAHNFNVSIFSASPDTQCDCSIPFISSGDHQ